MQSIEIDGIKYRSLLAACKSYNKKHSTVRTRLMRGESLDTIFHEPLKPVRQSGIVHVFGQDFSSLREACKILDFDYNRVLYKCKKGVPLEEAMTHSKSWIKAPKSIALPGFIVCKDCKEILTQDHFHAGRVCKVCYESRRLIRTYGISLKEKNSLLLQQNNKCAICLDPLSLLGRGSHVDHCHRTSKIRGILCYRCNIALGMLQDNIDIAQSLISYLEIHSISIP